ncbi:c-type cytochrome [Pararhodobacter sp.]|uniref:c-type cytochrome n=1 Tax=Pararhodobacter sp. TaxID=2127056 RepID=UPI002FDEBF4C
MFDTMVLTKAVAGLCTALLFLLVGKWVADEVYMPYGAAPEAYVIDLGEDAAAEDEGPVEEIDVMALYAEADASAGEGLWRNCRACHSLEEGRNGTGPYLYGVVGREIDVVAGFNYSGALEQLGEIWTVETLNHFLENPRAAAPGTTMGYAGMRSLQDRLNLIAYLETQGG